MDKSEFYDFMLSVITDMERQGRYSTAHVYHCALKSAVKYGGHSLHMEDLTPGWLQSYQEYLLRQSLLWNTISTYMRMLRSIYNRGVEAGNAPFVPRLFHEAYTGIDVCQKRALTAAELHRLLFDDPRSERLRRIQDIASLLFQLCGMSFADLAHLEKSALENNMLRYNRIKTKTPMSVEVLDSAMVKIDRLRSVRKSQPGCPDYLLDILCGDKSRKDEKAYREYQSALRQFNKNLKELAKALHLKSPVTSYTLRHSWATIAKYRGVSIEMISEALGHKSIKTTQTYLKGFGLEERTEVNKGNLSYIRNCKVKG